MLPSSSKNSWVVGASRCGRSYLEGQSGGPLQKWTAGLKCQPHHRQTSVPPSYSISFWFLGLLLTTRAPCIPGTCSFLFVFEVPGRFWMGLPRLKLFCGDPVDLVFWKRSQWLQLHECCLRLDMCHLHGMAGITVRLAGILALNSHTYFGSTCVMELFGLKIIKALSIWMCHIPVWFNSLASGRSEWNLRWVISKLILMLDGWGISWKIALRWMSLDLIHDN